MADSDEWQREMEALRELSNQSARTVGIRWSTNFSGGLTDTRPTGAVWPNGSFMTRSDGGEARWTATYWDAANSRYIHGLPRGSEAKAALKLLKSPRAKWAVESPPVDERPDPSSPIDGLWVSSDGISDPVRVMADGRVIGYAAILTFYGFDGISVEDVVEIDLDIDEEGRVTRNNWKSLYKESRDSVISYGNSLAIPSPKGASVAVADFERATEAVTPVSKLRLLSTALAAAIAPGPRSMTLLDAVKFWVSNLNEEWIIDAKWKRTSSGADVWLDNPFTGDRTGVRYGVRAQGLLMSPYSS